VLFSYLGWNASVYVASEIREPQRNLPRSLFIGLGVCTALYLVMNALYLHALPIEALAGEPRAGEAAAVALFGPAGGTLVGALILLSVLGCLNATILVGPRIAYAMALDGMFFAGSERVHERFRTPHVAIVVQAATAIGLIVVLQRFPSVLDYTTFAIVLATIADTSALYALRAKRPHVARPYRAWGYPIVPALYLAANVAIALAMLWGRPLECAVALLVTASGLPFLAAFGRRRGPTRPRAR
jgi:APA family basic amino acid/polyamine antiporter